MIGAPLTPQTDTHEMSADATTDDLQQRLEETDATVRRLAQRFAAERARINYDMEIEQWDVKKKEPRLDDCPIALTFGAPLNERATLTQTVSKEATLARHMRAEPGHAFHVRLMIELENPGFAPHHVRITRTTGPLAAWNATTYFVHNNHGHVGDFVELPAGKDDAANGDWVVRLHFDVAQVISAVTLEHDPAKCVDVVSMLRREAEAAEEERLVRMSTALPLVMAKRARK